MAQARRLSKASKKTEKKVFPKHMDGLYEDPVIWRTEVQYHMIINDWQGRIAYHQRSKDGIHWVCDPGMAYTVGIAFYGWRRLPYHHAVWHLCVLAGTVFHFVAIYAHVIPGA